MDDKTWSAGNLRLVPYTRESLARQEARLKSSESRRGEHRGRKERTTKLPECESVYTAPNLLPKEVFYTPLEDVGQFGPEKVFCVLAERSSNYHLYRFPAKDSLFLFSPWSSVRTFAIRISCHRFFDLFILAAILLNCIFLSLSHPVHVAEYVFLVIFTFEMIIKIIAKGFIVDKYSYLRSAWNWIDIIVVISGYTSLCLLTIGIRVGNISVLRGFRILRALKTVTHGLRIIVSAMLHSLRMLVEVMTLTVFCLMVFALLALQLYLGVLRHKCVLNDEASSNISESYALQVNSRSMWLLDSDGQPAVCGNKSGSRRCPANYTCLPDIDGNPNFGFTNFDTYGWALLTTFQLITLDFWEDIYNKINATTGPTSVFFFMLVVFFGSFYLINLTLAVVTISYEEEAEKIRKEQEKMKRVTISLSTRLYSSVKAQTVMFLPTFENQSGQPHIPAEKNENVRSTADIPIRHSARTSSPENTLYEEDKDEEGQMKKVKQRLGEAPDIVISTEKQLSTQPHVTVHVFDADHSPSRNQNVQISWCRKHFGRCFMFDTLARMRGSLVKMVHDPLFEMLIVLLIIICIMLNIIFLSFKSGYIDIDHERVLQLGNIVFTSIFSLEIMIRMLALGCCFFRSKLNLIDLTVVILSIVGIILGGFAPLLTFRLFRMMKLVLAWSKMRLLLAIIVSTLGAVGNMTVVLAVMIYIFAIMGLQLFRDVYTVQNFEPFPVPRWNFSDFWHSYLLMFRILCGEWVQPLWDCMVGGAKYQICIVFFLVVLIVGNFLVLNLFVALLLNSFNSKELLEKNGPEDSDPKILKGYRRIRRLVSSSNEAQQASIEDSRNKMASTEDPQVGTKRRWSEPGLMQLPTSPRRTSSDMSISVGDKLNIARGTSGSLSNYRATKKFDDASKNLSLLPSVETAEEHRNPIKTQDISVPVDTTKKDKKLKDPPDCCSSCLYTYIDMSGQPFFPYWYRSRRCILAIVDHKAFEWVVLVLIFCSSVVLCFEDVFLPEKPLLMLILGYFNIFFTACFVIEVFLKWMAYGFIEYFRSLWSCMDFLIVVASVVSVIAESSGSGLYVLRAFRTLRALRPLRAISRWQGMKIVVNALMSAIPSIFNVIVVCLLSWLPFAIMGVYLFGGRFYRCEWSSLALESRTLPIELAPDRNHCHERNYTWVTPAVNFDNVGNAYLALFQVATFEGWTDVIENAIDIAGGDLQPRTDANLSNLLYFIVFIICGSFFTLNLFIGVIIDNFNMLKKKYDGGIVEMFLTESQRAYYTAMLKLGKRKPDKMAIRPTNPFLRICYDVAMSRRFEMAVFVLIILNTIAMTVEHYQQPEEITTVLETLNIIFTVIFGVEALIKIIGLRQHYFKSPWNIFDMTVIIMSVIGIIFEEALQKLVISPTLLRVIRLIRIGRILRLIKAAKGIRKLLFALIISLPALFNIGALLFLVTFVYAIMGMSLFGHVRVYELGSSPKTGGLSDVVNFQTFANSMVLLFRLATSSGWNDVLTNLMEEEDCDRGYKGHGDCGSRTIAIIYLVTYIIINFMVIINMYVAIILENLRQANKEDIGISEEDIERFYVCWSQFDPEITQFILYDQLTDFVASLDPPLGIEKPNEPALIAMNIPIVTGDRIHCLDIIHSLVNLALGNVEETEEFRAIQRQIDERFRNTFPTRNLVEIISTTLNRKQQDNAAKLIQRTYKKHRSRLQNEQDDNC